MSLVWKGGSGLWSTPGNWAGATDPSLFAPGTGDVAQVMLGAGAVTITGPGQAAEFDAYDAVTLAGSFDFTSLQVRAQFTSVVDFATGNVTVPAGADVAATGLYSEGGVTVTGTGAVLAVSGGLTLGTFIQLPIMITTFGLTSGQLQVQNGGSVSAGSVQLNAAFFGTVPTITVGAAGTMEIGNTGGAPAGALSIDAGHALTGLGTVNAAIINNGTIEASGNGSELLVLNGAISGTGALVVDAGRVLSLSGTAGVGQTVSLVPTSGLDLSPGGSVTGQVSGFDGVDNFINIPVGNTIAAVNSGATATTLTLAGAKPQTVVLSGDYRGDAFYAKPTASFGVSANGIALVPGSAPLNLSQSFGNFSIGGATPQVISGGGTASYVTIQGEVFVSGAFQFTTLLTTAPVWLGTQWINDTTKPASLVYIATGAAVIDSAVAVGGPFSQLVAGNLSFANNAAAPSLTVTNSATVFANTATLDHAVITVDATGTVEIGSARLATVSGLSVDAGITIGGTGFSLNGAVANAGIIQAFGASSINGALTGSGSVYIEPGATFSLNGSVAAAQTLDFVALGNAANATLDLRSAPGTAGTIFGMLAGDVVELPAGIDGATYTKATSGPFLTGTLALSQGGTLVSTLNLAGDYAGQSFTLTPNAGGVALTTSAGQPRTLLWASTSGDWTTASNWADATGTLQIATAAPTGNDLVQVLNGGSIVDITGSGRAAAMAVYGADTFEGTYEIGSTVLATYNAQPAVMSLVNGGQLHTNTLAVTGTLSMTGAGSGVSVTGTLTDQGSVTVSAGATLSTTSVTLPSLLTVSGPGSVLNVSGTLALKGPSGANFYPSPIGGTLVATNHALVQATAMDLTDNYALHSNYTYGHMTIDATSAVELGTAGNPVAGALNIDAGHALTLGTVITGDLVNNGFISFTPMNFLGVLNGPNQFVTGSISGTGTLQLNGYGSPVTGTPSAVIPGAVGAGQTLDLENMAHIQLQNPAAFAGTMTGKGWFGIDVAGVDSIGFTPGASGGVLSMFHNGAPLGTINVTGTYDASNISLFAPGTVLFGIFACFATGTRIRTARGEVAVEALLEGDLVVSAFGGTAPVTWIGHRRVDCRRHTRPWDVMPVRVAAGAFGAGQPARDLLLSPDHAVYVDGVLVPIRYLVNGGTVAQVEVPEVTYWHVELPAHDVLFAEGLPAESYLDTGNRSAFANGGAAVMLHADFARGVWEAEACAPLLTDGPEVMAVRERLLARARALGHRLSGDPGLRVVADGRALAMTGAGARREVVLPEGTERVAILSRRWVPAHVRAAEADARVLGVAIAGVRLDGVAVPLDGAAFAAGWHAAEPGWRWTGGRALLRTGGARRLSFEVAMTGDYWLDTPPAVAGVCARA